MNAVLALQKLEEVTGSSIKLSSLLSIGCVCVNE